MKKITVAEIPEPKLARFLFSDSRIGWVWLLVRVYVGWQWLEAGWGKAFSPAWTGDQAGAAIRGFLAGALQKAAGSHPDVSTWYAAFLNGVALPHAVFFSYLVAYGEVFAGIALIAGAFTGIAAFAGAFMNLNYLFAGTVSINPFLLLLELFLMLAWRNAGWWGADRFLLPKIGVPWRIKGSS